MGRPRTFRQADLERAIRAAKKQGLNVCGYKISPTGEIEVLTGSAPTRELTPFEKWQAEQNGDRAA